LGEPPPPDWQVPLIQLVPPVHPPQASIAPKGEFVANGGGLTRAKAFPVGNTINKPKVIRINSFIILIHGSV